MQRFALLVLSLIVVIIACNNESSTSKKSSFGFKKVSSGHSGIDFVNVLKEDVSTNENLFDFDYFYNGGGVAIVDINNDDLLDVIFTANQSENKIYLNEGGLKFKDITSQSGINVNKHWSNGITTVDINNDGLQDLYISQGGPHERDKRNNLLFVNNGDLTFTERAAEYGLADQGISTQSAFFDFDKDGDLDCFVMNESLLYGYDPISFQRNILEQTAANYVSFSHLYENKNGTYVDISEDAGITKPTYGLGLAIADINDDDYLDIYVANDYYLPDNVYINRKNGTFRDRSKTHLTQTSFFGMGVDIADVNNDGHQDIYVLDMASQDHVRSKTLMASMDVESFDLLTDKFGFLHQYMFNSLQLNNGEGRFKNIAHSAGVAKTDWSWSALIEDVDLDGYKDIFVSNGYRKYALDNDFKNEVVAAKRKFNGKVPLNIKQELYDEMPTESLPNILFHNNGGLSFENIASEIGLSEPTYSNGAALADLDNDGDLDLVINNIDQEALLYENNASESSNYIIVQLPDQHNEFVDVSIKSSNGIQSKEIRKVRGYRSSIDSDVLFGLGDVKVIDELIIDWKDGTHSIYKNTAANQTIEADKNIATQKSAPQNSRKFNPYSPIALGLDYVHRENSFNDFETEILLPQKQSTLGPCISQADVNGDGHIDLFIGGASGQAATLYLSDGKKFIKQKVSAFDNDGKYEDISSVFFDLDGDDDLDLYVVSGGNEWPEKNENYRDRLYINDGLGSFEKASFDLGVESYVSGGVVKSLDFDNDGDLDLLVGNRIRPQSYPIAAPSFLLQNNNGILENVTEERFADLSSDIINDIEIVNLNNDDYPDVVVTGEWSGIRFYKNEQGSFVSDLSNESFRDSVGWWFSVTPVDIDHDGLEDLLVGNVGTNIKHKASPKKPFKIYAHDFDQSGSLDIVLSNQYKNKEVPVRGKECSSQQMPFISDKFPKYSDFATSSLIDIYGDENINAAYDKSVNVFRSCFLKQTTRGRYEWLELPAEANHAPILDALSMDLNGDKIDDIILAGSIYNTEVETPRLDGGTGSVLISSGSHDYSYGPCPDYCFYSSGNNKKLEHIRIGEKQFLLVLKNNEELSMFEIKNQEQ